MYGKNWWAAQAALDRDRRAQDSSAQKKSEAAPAEAAKNPPASPQLAGKAADWPPKKNPPN